jgi:PAS domain S-box-containing protein
MADKPTYKELEQRVKELEKEIRKYKSLGKEPRENEKRYRDLYENAPNAYFSVSAEDGSILRCNTAVLKLLGYNRDTLMGMKVLELYADNPHGISKAKEVFKQFKEGKSIQDVELQMKHMEGHPIWISLSVEPVEDHKGNITESRSMVIDISERKRSEEALRKKTHDLGERVKELNCLYGIGNLVERQDISLEEIFQGTVDLIPLSWQYPEITCARIIIQDREWKTKNFRETIWKQASDIKVHGELSGNLEVYYLEEKPEINEGPFLREERNLINAITRLMGRIVERKQGEEALRESEEKYRTLLETTSEGCWLINPELKTVEVNATLCKMLGYSQEEMLGKTPFDFVDDENRKIFIEKTSKISTTLHRSYEITLKKKNGEDLQTYFNATTIRDESGEVQGAFAFITDITERKRAEEHIHTLNQEMLKAQESERQMIYRELNDRVAQELSAVRIGLETLFDNQHTTPPEIRRRVSEMSRTLQESIKAVRDLSYDLRPPVLDETGLLRILLQYCHDFSEDTGINVDFHSAGMKDLKLDFDTENSMYRLIQEGLTNIKKHANADHVTIRLVPNIILRIEDNGRGFDVKKRLATITKEKRMGIRSMEQRVKLLQGEMELQSRPMQGTKISIKLPYKDKKSGS